MAVKSVTQQQRQLHRTKIQFQSRLSSEGECACVLRPSSHLHKDRKIDSYFQSHCADQIDTFQTWPKKSILEMSVKIQCLCLQDEGGVGSSKGEERKWGLCAPRRCSRRSRTVLG